MCKYLDTVGNPEGNMMLSYEVEMRKGLEKHLENVEEALAEERRVAKKLKKEQN